MTKSKPGRPPLNPGEPLTKIIQARVSPRMCTAFRKYAGARGMAAVVRSLIAEALKNRARKRTAPRPETEHRATDPAPGNSTVLFSDCP